MSTSMLLAAVAPVGFLLAIAAVFMLRADRDEAAFAYRKLGPLLTPAERSFFGVLDQAVGRDYRIFAKVRIADVIGPERNPNRAEWHRAFNRISAKHFDFVLCDPATLAVVYVVELDDSSHAKPERTRRDSLVARVCRSAQLPLVRLAARRTYSLEEIRASLRAALAPPCVPDVDLADGSRRVPERRRHPRITTDFAAELGQPFGAPDEPEQRGAAGASRSTRAEHAK
jgi:hypothetical protein